MLPSFINFAFPLMLTSLMMQSYTIADGLILGNLVNERALGAVNSISPIIDLLGLIQIGLSGGCSICISHLTGSGEHRRMHQVILQMRTVVVGISLLALLLGVLGADAVLSLTHTPPEIYDGAKAYLQLVCIGIPFSSIYQLQSGIMRGMGDSKRPLGAITISTFTNIGLDLLLVGFFTLGIIGAAVATVASQIFSCVYLYFKLKKRLQAEGSEYFSGSFSLRSQVDILLHSFSRSEKASDIHEIVNLGIPQMLQSSFTSIGKIILQSLTNSFGAFAVIGVAASYKIDSILIIP